jgi:hypothetical protein
MALLPGIPQVKVLAHQMMTKRMSFPMKKMKTNRAS